MDYEDFELQIGPRRGDGYALRVLRSPEGQAEGLLRLPDLNDGSGDRELGARLYRALFQGPVGACFHQSLSRVGGDGSRGLRLRLRINPGDRELAPLHDVPWERLYRQDTQDFLALSRRTAIVRTLDLPRAVRCRKLEPPLRVVVVLAQGLRGEPLDLETEARGLESLASDTPDLELDVLRDPDLATLRGALDRGGAHVLHYLGHGHFNARTGAGSLLLAGESGGVRKLDGRTLATKVKDLESLRLVVLNACHTARSGVDPAHDPFAGVATALILGGIPAVVAMQQPVTDRRALAFSAPFYAALAERRSLEEAVTEGRQGMLDLGSRDAEWPIPVLFLSSPTGEMLPPKSLQMEGIPVARGEAVRRPWIRALGGVPAVVVGALLLLALLVDTPLRTALVEVVPWIPIGLAKEEPPPGHLDTPARSITKLSMGSWELEIVFPAEFDAATKSSLIQSLRRAMEPAAGSAGRTIRVDVSPPQVQSIQRAGSSLWSCHLTAVGPELGTVPAVHARAVKNEACELAARELAQKIARKLAQHEEEMSQ